MTNNNDLLTRRVAKILPDKAGLEKLISGKKIRLYQGFDPTGGHLHLGHAVGMRKLMDFANAGHEVIFLFGTGTVLVGDPSLRDTGRKLITQDEIDENIKDWKRQVSPIVDFSKVTIKQNGDWLTRLTLKDIIGIASNISATQLFKRESFTRRIEKGDPVWYHETMYPLLQGYDSVVMDVDLEIGGTDQEFNMLIGRELQHKMNNRDKFVLMTPMIPGTDGQKMSKSIGNCIYLDDKPDDIYTKLMSIQDNLITTYFELLTDLPMDEIRALDPSKPIENKKRLAYDITRQLHGESGATKGQDYFETVIQPKAVPADIPTVNFPFASLPTIEFAKIISPATNSTTSEMKRLATQGGLSLNDKKLTDLNETINIETGDIVKVGKNKYIKVKVEK
jgi:tyrosyl-tRNA synthetase